MNPTESTGFLQEMNWIDVGALVVLLFFLVMGLIRGFFWQALQVVKVVGGILAARMFAATVGGWIAGEKLQPPYTTYLAYIIIFVGFAIAVSIVAYLLEESLNKLKLKSYDRVAGAGLGLVSGWLLLVVVVTLLYSNPPLSSTRTDIESSYAGAYAARTSLLARGLLPPEIREQLEKFIKPDNVDRLAEETRDRRLPLPGGDGLVPTQADAEPPAPK